MIGTITNAQTASLINMLTLTRCNALLALETALSAPLTTIACKLNVSHVHQGML